MASSEKSRAALDVMCAILWTLVIYATIPFMQPVMQYLGARLGHDAGLNKIMASIVFLTIFLFAAKLVRRRGFGVERGLWLSAVIAGYGYFMWIIEIPPEKIHFFEFGILVILVFRALRHSFAAPIVYFAVLPVCLMVGLSDEYIQSKVPKRVGEIADVLQWDLSAILLALICIVKAWVPEGRGKIARRQVWIVLGLWVAMLISCAGFVQLLSDFGHRLEDPSIGTFNSAFGKEDLTQTDAGRGSEAAVLIDASEDSTYGQFLQKYTHRTDPYVHESRVHLFRRDRYLRKSGDTDAEAAEDEKTKFLHIAVMENRILESHFAVLMKNSRRRWPDELKTGREEQLTARHALTPNYESAVGARMITSFSLKTLWSIMGLACAGLVLSAAFIAGRCPD